MKALPILFGFSSVLDEFLFFEVDSSLNLMNELFVVLGFREEILKVLVVGVGLVELVELIGKLGVLFLEFGEVWVFVWESREAVIVFVELPVRGFELIDLLLKTLIVGISFLEKFLKKGDVGDKAFLVFQEIV